MTVKKAKSTNKPKKKKAAPPVSKEQMLLQYVAAAVTPDLIKKLEQLVWEGEHTRTQLSQLEGRLEKLLTQDQREAADICGVTRAQYAIECMEIWKERIFAQFPNNLMSLAELRKQQFNTLPEKE